MNRVDELNKLRSSIDDLQKQADRAAGALEGTMTRLQEEHGCSTIEEAEDKLAKLERKLEREEKRFDERLADFKEAYSEELE